MCCFCFKYFGCFYIQNLKELGGAAAGPWRCLGFKGALPGPPGTPLHLRYFGCLTTSVSHFEKELRYSNFCTLTVEGVGGAAVGPWRCLGSEEALATPPGTPSHSSEHNLVRQTSNSSDQHPLRRTSSTLGETHHTDSTDPPTL